MIQRRFTRHVRRRPGLDDDRILPLINIVFLLLIFFMVAGQLSTSDPFQIQPVESVSSGDPTLDGVLVTIGRDGALALNGEIMDEAVLMSRISATEATEVRIKSDQSVQAIRVVGLLNRIKAAGIVEIKLMTVPSRAGAL